MASLSSTAIWWTEYYSVDLHIYYIWCILQWGKWKVSSWEEKDHQWWEKSYLVQIWSHTGFSGEDILFAMSTLGFDNYVEPLKLYLQKYREAMKVCLKKEPITTWVLHSLVFRVRGKWRRSFPTLEEKLWLDSSFRFGIPHQFPPSNYWPFLLTTLLVWYKICVLLIWPCDLFCSFQALTASEGDVLLTYSNGQQFQL